MFKLIFGIIKLAIFTVVVLIASHHIKWDGKTVSDQVKTHMSQAQKSPALEKIRRKKPRVHTIDTIDLQDRNKLKELIRNMSGK